MDDFSGLEYDQESVSEEDVVSKTNNLLSQFNLPTQVTSVHDITASLFVVLYESLFSDRLPGIVRQPVTREDEISNCQMVIDVLSADVIKDNLSHIRGVDIVEGKVQAINNLLDIFTFLYEYVIKQIESDVPTDTDDDVRSFDRLEAVVEDSDTYLPRSAPQIDSHQPGSSGGRKEHRPNGKDQAWQQKLVVGDTLQGAGEGNGAVAGAAARANSPTAVSAPSPIPPVSTSLMGQKTVDSTADLIQEGEQLNRQFEKEKHGVIPKTAEEKPGSADSKWGFLDFIGLRRSPTAVTTAAAPAALDTQAAASSSSLRPGAQQDAVLESALPVSSSAFSHDPYFAPHHPNLANENMSATEPIPSKYRRSRSRSPGRMRHTVGAIPDYIPDYIPDRIPDGIPDGIPDHSPQSPGKSFRLGDAVMKGLSSSYETLHQMVQKTAALTRAAIDKSPLRRHQDPAAQLDITDLGQERRCLSPFEGMALATELNQGATAYHGFQPLSIEDSTRPRIYDGGEKPSSPVSLRSPGSLRSPLAIESDTRSMSSRKSPIAAAAGYAIPPNTDYVRPSVRPVAATYRADRQPVPQSIIKTQQSLRDRERGDHFNLDQELAKAAELAGKIPAAASGGRPLDSKEAARRRSRLSNRLLEMGKMELANAQRRLETEHRMFHQKKAMVKKMYKEDFGDAKDEVNGLLNKDQKQMKDMEEEYKKLMQLLDGSTAKKPKPAPKPKGFLIPRGKKSKSKTQQTKSKSNNATLNKSSSACAVASKPRERPLSLAEDEDLMSVLMEEFPYLYLSDHTWHELWRKGIGQIESLTRAYEENKRRKSKAQVQLEEAAKKHEVLAGIVKKQLDHNQRMQQIREQKKQQVMMNNKVHEKRSQSARARKYYDEYQVRARAKVLKRRSKEELVFKSLFKDGLAIQKERIQDVRRYAKEQRERQALKRQDEIDSLENFYRDQFDLLVEKMVKDKSDMTSREKAHQKVLEQMKKDLRSKMEKEISDIQFQMFRDDDDVYLRQLEADRLRHELQHAKFQTRV